MSAMSFLYLFTGCLDLALMAGQKKQRVPQAGRTWREITPETALIFSPNFPNIKQLEGGNLNKLKNKLERVSS